MLITSKTSSINSAKINRLLVQPNYDAFCKCQLNRFRNKKIAYEIENEGVRSLNKRKAWFSLLTLNTKLQMIG